MNQVRLIFAQWMEFFPRYEFSRIQSRWRRRFRVRNFSCMDQFLCMAFAQLTGRESLRDIEICLRAMKPKLYHVGLRGMIARSTLADANERRPWQIWWELARVLIARARRLYAEEPLGVELAQAVYAFDASIIDLCLALFPWAEFRKNKGGIKLHTLLDLRGNLPVTAFITPASVHEVNMLDRLRIEPGALYLLDRGFLDFARLHRIHRGGAWFVIRAKRNTQLRRLYSRPVDKATGLRCDQTVVLGGFYAARDYPDHLRRIRFFDPDQGRRLVFLTNEFNLPALTIAELYRQRWQVELFFKWIKQHLRIKSFFGTTANAVKTQIWIAIAVYVLAAIVKKELKLEHSLYTILQILSVTLFEKMPILQALSQIELPLELGDDYKQLTLFDF